MIRSLSLTIAFLLALPVFGFASGNNPPKTIEVQGHRGARSVRPENTLAAFRYALEVGVDTLELDLGVTKDDVLVLSHDPVIDPVICLDKNGNRLKKEIEVRTLTLKQVKTYDCGSLVNPRFPRQQKSPGEKIPTLDEVFDLVKKSKLPIAKKVKFNIETKIVPGRPNRTPAPRAFAKLLVDAVEKHGMVSRTTIQSFDHRTLVEVRKMNANIQIAALMGGNLPNLVAVAKDLDADIISPNQYWITREAVKGLQQMGVQVIPWTANSVAEWDALIKLGVDGIITDDPKPLIEHLKKKGLR